MTKFTSLLAPIALAGLATAATAQEATFAMVDVDGDGFLAEAELTAAFGEVGRQLLRYDLDGDGRLTAEEMQARNEDRAEAGLDAGAGAAADAAGQADAAAEGIADAAADAAAGIEAGAEAEAEVGADTETGGAAIDLDAGVSLGASN